MYIVAYNIVFAMRNEPSMANNKKIKILYYCLTLQCMIQLSIWFDRHVHVVRLLYIDINMDTVYL